MSTTTPSTSTALATIRPLYTESERLALAGFLAGYRGLTREAYTLDLRAQNQVWCEIVALACELLSWTQMLALAGKARRPGPPGTGPLSSTGTIHVPGWS
jgi:hypothetical protein